MLHDVSSLHYLPIRFPPNRCLVFIEKYLLSDFIFKREHLLFPYYLISASDLHICCSNTFKGFSQYYRSQYFASHLFHRSCNKRNEKKAFTHKKVTRLIVYIDKYFYVNILVVTFATGYYSKIIFIHFRQQYSNQLMIMPNLRCCVQQRYNTLMQYSFTISMFLN